MPVTGNTGWLKPNASRVTTPAGQDGTPWALMSNMAFYTNDYSVASVNRFEEYNYRTKRLAWDWVVPGGAYPGNSEVVGIEARVWVAYQKAGDPTPTEDVHLHHLRFGNVYLFNEDTSASSEIPVYDGSEVGAGQPTQGLTLGGASSLFGLAAGTRVSDFFAQAAIGGIQGPWHATLAAGIFTGPDANNFASVRLFHVELRVHWEVPDTQVDVDADDLEGVASFDDATLYRVRTLAAPFSVVASFDDAALSGDQNIAAALSAAAELDADLTNKEGGVGAHIDSTAFPATEAGFDSAGLQRVIDMAAAIEVPFSVEAHRLGNAIDLGATFDVQGGVIDGLTTAIEMQTDPEVAWVSASINPVVPLANINMAAAPLVTAVIDQPDLEGDIVLGGNCEVDQLCFEIEASIFAELAFTKEMYASPLVVVSLGVVPGALISLAAQPCVEVSISKAKLGSKFAEPAPIDRTLHICPDDNRLVVYKQSRNV